ncbi:Do family serine endopeptidase [Candidatus Odyssella thessalonicensis]|uniref:Do family serine endopeptidase n=1 Tax=Candidatus Odyssella thessalonicensis TaxID=84647 RepID=UPI000225AC20|nr:Do family serine endopeptidase [Candidatus Odyssella thessalonicensis]
MSKIRLLLITSFLASSMVLTSWTYALSAKVEQKSETGISSSTSSNKKSNEKSASETLKVKEEVKATDHKQEPPCNARYDVTKGFSGVAEKTIPSVVNVSTTQIIEGRERNLPQLPPGSPFEDLFRDFFEQMDKPKRVQSLGSGFIVKVHSKGDDPYAYVVTNFHVVSEAKKITIVLHEGSELEAVVQAVDERTDLAMLKVKLGTLAPEKRNLKPVEWGDSNRVNVGDWCVAIGNPFGLGSTVTSGIISNRSRNIGVRGNAKSRLSEYVDDFMQHDASINMGNSGGPLFDLEGKIIGVNTAIFSPSGGNVGIGFAIPSNLVKETVDQLIEFGRTRRGWLGVRIQSVTDEMAESLGFGKARGAIVGAVTPKGPAAVAGIEAGDIILEFDGKEINEKTRLSRVVGETEVGKKVKVKLWRKGKEVIVEVALGEFETSSDGVVIESKDKKDTSSNIDITEVLGLKVSKITGSLSQQYKIKEDMTGAVVVGVNGDSPAASALRPGDVITEVNQSDIKSPEELVKAVEEAKRLKRKHITFLISRGGDMVYITTRIEDDLKS